MRRKRLIKSLESLLNDIKVMKKIDYIISYDDILNMLLDMIREL